MKVKALRFKDTKEFVNIQFFGEEPIVGSCAIPTLHPITATISGMKNVFANEDYEKEDIDFDNMEFIELDVFEAGEVGADIRNKLSPPKNLVEMLEIFFEPKIAHVSEERAELAKLIQKEMKQTKESVDYLAKLL